MEYNNIIVNEYLKGCTNLRVALHNVVYRNINILDGIGDISSNTTCTVRLKNDKEKLLSVVDVENRILATIKKYKEELVKYNDTLESIIDSVLNGTISVNNLYDDVSISKNDSCILTINL